MKTKHAVALVSLCLAIGVGYIFTIFNSASQYDAYYLFRVVNEMIEQHPIVRASRTAVITQQDKKIWFPQHIDLESDFNIFQKEILSLLQDYSLQEFRNFDNANSYILRPNDKWRVLPLMLLGKYINVQYAPRTVAALKRCCGGGSIRNVFVSVLEPGSQIAPHTGNFMSVVRYHLCLSNPEPTKMFLGINDTKLYWHEGKSFMFDDMYMHTVVNRSNQRRVVLFLDVVRYNIPLHLRAMDATLHWLATFSSRYSDYVAGSAPTRISRS